MARTFTKPSAFTNFEEAHSRTKKDLEHKSKAYLRKREQANEKIDKENEVGLHVIVTEDDCIDLSNPHHHSSSLTLDSSQKTAK